MEHRATNRCHIELTLHQYHNGTTSHIKPTSRHFATVLQRYHTDMPSYIDISLQPFTTVSHRYHTSITTLLKQYHNSITPISHQYHIGIISARRKRIFFTWDVPETPHNVPQTPPARSPVRCPARSPARCSTYRILPPRASRKLYLSHTASASLPELTLSHTTSASFPGSTFASLSNHAEDSPKFFTGKTGPFCSLVFVMKKPKI